jgi:hypothetical protein
MTPGADAALAASELAGYFLSSLRELVPLFLAYPRLAPLRLRSGQAVGWVLSPLYDWG